MKKNLTKNFLLFVYFIFGLISCSPEIPKDPNTLLYHLYGEPNSLNRLTATDAYASNINNYLFDSLITRDNETLEWKPKIAKDWEISEDKLTYTFHLRPDVTWHDGKPVTADDVVYTFQKIMDPKVDAPHLRVYYHDIKEVTKIDDHTVRFTYSQPYFLGLSFIGGIPIIPKHIFDNGEDFNSHKANRQPVGNGPYQFVEWKTGKHLILKRNENYWDKEHSPHLDKIHFKIIPDDTISLQALKKRELDLSSLRPIQWFRQTNSKKFEENFLKHQYYTPGYRFIGWNLRKPQFQDKRVRKAFTHLTNRDEVLEKLEYGLGKITTGPFWVFGDDYDATIEPIPFDPNAAKKLLDEAGWIDRDGDGIREKDGQKLKFTFLLPSGVDLYTRLATIMKKDFEEAGIAMDIRTMEWATFVSHLNSRQFDAVALAWSFDFDQDPYQVWHSSQGNKGSNFVGFQNREADRIIEQARVIFDKPERNKLYQRLHQIIHEEQPYTFLYTGPALVVRDKRFKNVKVYKGGIDILEWQVSK